TDAAGDDIAAFDGNKVVFRLGSGASSTQGGLVPPGQGSSVRFRVKVDADPALVNTSITNTARVDHFAETLPGTYDGESSIVSGPVRGLPSLSSVKAMTLNDDEDASGTVSVGDTLHYSVTVTNDGDSTLTNVVVTDSIITPSTITCATLSPTAPD